MTHHFFDIAIDRVAPHIDKSCFFALVFEHAPVRIFQKLLQDPRNLVIANLAALIFSRLASELEDNLIGLDQNVSGPERGYSVTTVLAGINVTTRAHEAPGKNS